MKRINIYIISLIMLCFAAYSCNGWLDVTPNDRQTETGQFATRSGFYAAINGVYSLFSSDNLYGKRLSYEFIEIIGLRYSVSSQNDTYTAMAKRSYTSEYVEPVIDDIWSSAYTTILNINTVLKNLDTQKGLLSAEEVELVRGEMLGLRAYLHFDMFRLFAPQYDAESEGLTLPYNANDIILTEEFITAKSFFEKVLADITEAETYLAEDNVLDGGAAFPEDDMGVDNYNNYRQLRFNYYALELLKARVYLWMGDKANALTTAKAVINNSKFNELFPAADLSRIIANNVNPDRIFSTEVLFAYSDADRADVYDNSFNTEYTSTNLLQPKEDYVDGSLFGGLMADVRLQACWGTTASSSNPNKTLIRYKPYSANDSDYFCQNIMPIMRRSEFYLIVAECEPDFAAGYTALNQLRVERNNSVIDAVDANSLKTEIVKEYLREFYGEGHSFFLFKRNKSYIGNDINGMSSYDYYNISKYVLPMPESELLPR